MYNGVGLQTARGSGTSGFVQANIARVAPGQKAKLQDYGKILKQLKEAPQPLPKPPNQELIMHEKKRKIEGQLFSLGKKLREAGAKTEEEIQGILKEERRKMHDDLKNEDKVDLRNAHEAALAKERHMDKLKAALQIGPDFEAGAAFDFELQEQKRLARLAEKDRRRKEEKRQRKQAKKDQ